LVLAYWRKSTTTKTTIMDIKLERVKKNMTQKDLAEKANLYQSHVSLIESGKMKANQSTLERIAKALEIESIKIVINKV